MITHRIERCSICQVAVVASLEAKPLYSAKSPHIHCGRAACVTESTLVPDDTELAGLRLGQRIDADIYRGGVSDDDGITRGSRLITKAGSIRSISVIGARGDIVIDFDDGDYQVAWTASRDGAHPGYPCAAFRLTEARGER